MHDEIQSAIEGFNGAMTIFKDMVSMQNSIILYGLIIFLISSIISLFIFRKNNEEVLKNILDITKYIASIMVVGYVLHPSIIENLDVYFKTCLFIYTATNIAIVSIYKAVNKKRKDINNENK